MIIRKLFKYLGIVTGSLLLLLILFVGTLYFSADMKQPDIPENSYRTYETSYTDSLRTYGPNHLYLSPAGLWELHVEGNAFERGIAFGSLATDLLEYQEKVFVDQIREFIPSDSYLSFLRFLLILFNRNLGSYVDEEFRQEIYGISLFCTDEYNAIGTPYERQLNYHAAHDIGHTMQDYMLVGCSSFGVWGSESSDSTLLIGRNFDFYVGDEFARHKIVSFYTPEKGYRFVAVGWAGMTGVLSGMNEAGLTVTINAARGALPTSAATPISILAREVLQYASTISEALAIVESRQTFVSESLLIGSSRDGRAVVIEKSPDRTALFESGTERIVCTNHYQSDAFKDDKRNIENIATSDSPYRMARLQELITQQAPLDILKVASILRNRMGTNNKEIGLSNEKAINQFIAHHGVIFQPEKGMMWVSTEPWQCGRFVAYNLHDIWQNKPVPGTSQSANLHIPADPFLDTPGYEHLFRYRAGVKKIKETIKSGSVADINEIEEFVTINPELYYTWELAGDYYDSIHEKETARRHWRIALEKEIPNQKERKNIERKLTS